MLTADKRCLALARTFLFNYGQREWTPFGNYRKVCRLLNISPILLGLPQYNEFRAPFSFHGKYFSYGAGACKHFMLYGQEDKHSFLALSSVEKLCWLQSFSEMQQLVCNFSPLELEVTQRMLETLPRPTYDKRIPFSISGSAAPFSGNSAPNTKQGNTYGSAGERSTSKRLVTVGDV